MRGRAASKAVNGDVVDGVVMLEMEQVSEM